MMTHQKLNIYLKYGGFNDLWLRMGSDEERKLLTSDDWMLIYSYLDNMALVKQGQLTEQGLVEVEDQIVKSCESQEVAVRFKSIVINQLNHKPSLIERFIDWLFNLSS